MNSDQAQDILREIRKAMNPTHVACTHFRQGALEKLTHAPEVPNTHAVLELHLVIALPGIHFFDGILDVDSHGIWYHNGDGDINGPIHKRSLIPWHIIKTLTVHL